MNLPAFLVHQRSPMRNCRIARMGWHDSSSKYLSEKLRDCKISVHYNNHPSSLVNKYLIARMGLIVVQSNLIIKG